MGTPSRHVSSLEGHICALAQIFRSILRNREEEFQGTSLHQSASYRAPLPHNIRALISKQT